MRRLSGDDDLLVQDAVALGARAAVVADAPAHTRSQPAATWAAWWRQKRRHLSAGSRYRAADRRRLGLFMGSNGLFYLLTPVVLAVGWNRENLVSLAFIWLVRTLLLLAVYRPLARRLRARFPPLLLPTLDFLFFVIYGAWGLSLFRHRSLQWK